MNRNDRVNDNQPADDPAGPGQFDDAVGVYLLDALDEAELAEFEAFLRDDLDAQAEVAALRPVVNLLPLALDERDLPQPSATLRSRILQAARDDGRSSPPGSTGSATPPIDQPRRPSGPSVPPIQRSSTAPGGTILPFVRRIGFERLAAGLLALIAAGAIIWGITLQSRLNNTKDDLDAARDEVALLQGHGGGLVQAVVYPMDPTEDGPETANAVVALETEASTIATISTTGMPPTEQGRNYQLWFITLDDAGEIEGAPRPSITFEVGQDGAIVVEHIPVDGPFDAVAITNEPVGGSPAPTTPVILFGTRGVAAG